MDLDFDVLSLPESDHPAVGETAPDFVRPLVTDEYWEDVALSTLTGDGPVALVCHPMVGSFPATYIWSELRDRGLDDMGASVVGLSISTPYDLTRFIETEGLAETDFAFVSDPGNDVAARYGIVNDLDGMNGVTEPRPAVFVIDRDRVVRYAWVPAEWPAFPDYDEFEVELASVVDGTSPDDRDGDSPGA